MDEMSEIATNAVLQSEEVDALSAIFENDFVLEDIERKVYSTTIQNSSKQSVYLQVTFPPLYPLSSPPTYLISAPWLNREAKHSLSLTLNEVYSQNMGMSIVFLWIETIKDFIEDTVKQFENVKTNSLEVFSTEDANMYAEDYSNTASSQHGNTLLVIEHGEIIIDKKSVFQAHASKVSSVEQVEEVLSMLKENRKIWSATHNVVAYRITHGNDILQDCDDDGESSAGTYLLNLLEAVNATDVVVVVSRWFGGCHLGNDRFKHYTNSAKSLLAKGGMVKQKTSKKAR